METAGQPSLRSSGLILTAFFAFISCAAVAWIWSRWSVRPGGEIDAMLRGIAAICFIAAVHFIGWYLYRRQFRPAARLPQLDRLFPWTGTDATPNLGLIIVQQAALLLIASLILDGGSMFKIVSFGIGVYWLAVLIGAVRCAGRPTPLDVLLMNIATLPLILTLATVQTLVWSLRGY